MSVSQSQSLICEVCGSDDLEEVLNLGEHPLCGDLVRFDEERTCKEYPIVIKPAIIVRLHIKFFRYLKLSFFHLIIVTVQEALEVCLRECNVRSS